MCCIGTGTGTGEGEGEEAAEMSRCGGFCDCGKEEFMRSLGERAVSRSVGQSVGSFGRSVGRSTNAQRTAYCISGTLDVSAMKW